MNKKLYVGNLSYDVTSTHTVFASFDFMRTGHVDFNRSGRGSFD
jgi:hypothetical protein